MLTADRKPTARPHWTVLARWHRGRSELPLPPPVAGEFEPGYAPSAPPPPAAPVQATVIDDFDAMFPAGACSTIPHCRPALPGRNAPAESRARAHLQSLAPSQVAVPLRRAAAAAAAGFQYRPTSLRSRTTT